MNLNEHVFQYCERASTAFWSEPVNALSNLPFMVAAWAVWRMLGQDRLTPDRAIPVSVGFTVPLMSCIGLGSFAFHTAATRWAQILDVAPIGLFVLWYLAGFLHWFHGLSWRRCLLGVAGFVGFLGAFVAAAGAHVPNKSGTYVPVLLLLIGLTAHLRTTRAASLRSYSETFAWATACFAVALLARTVDESVCGSFPLGTHFLWHLFDALVVLIVSRALVHRWRTRTGMATPGFTEPLRRVRQGPGDRGG
ncbi:ceramidase domain-containing protein [Streptomyces sp. NPDC126510]|uniref:ceramidase domain-containing protein n=1 Tax=Streptomyces sp. NPDC126510 TaxID=3155317 RepID=UPI00331D4658